MNKIFAALIATAAMTGAAYAGCSPSVGNWVNAAKVTCRYESHDHALRAGAAGVTTSYQSNFWSGAPSFDHFPEPMEAGGSRFTVTQDGVTTHYDTTDSSRIRTVTDGKETVLSRSDSGDLTTISEGAYTPETRQSASQPQANSNASGMNTNGNRPAGQANK